MDQISKIIRNRRSVYPRSYTDEPIKDAEIWEILENANWAPTHKKTEPWRFRVFRGAAKDRIGDYLADEYRKSTPDALFSEIKYEKMLSKPQRAACVIVISMQRDPNERLPEWEEIAAVACAVQNMWLTCSARGIGAYWSSPSSITKGPEFLRLEEGERCLGMFYMGMTENIDLPAIRQPIQEKVIWLEE